MIGFITGTIIDIFQDEKAMLVLAQNVGYRLTVNTELLANAKTGQTVRLFTHTAVREDDISLYGFVTKEEYGFFRQLTGVSGIGPKTAMDILSAPISITQNAIVNGDAGLLTKIKGVGKKTAERIILELKGKVIPTALKWSGTKPDVAQGDAIMALENLGYDKMHIIKVLAALPHDVRKTEEIVKYFLRQSS